jgi:hypothetical protein
MPNVTGFLATNLAGHFNGIGVRVLAAVVSTCLIVFAAWRWRQEDARGSANSPGPMFAAALTVSLVVAPHLYSHDLALMLLAVPLVLGCPQWPHPSVQRTILLAVTAILYTPPVYLALLLWWPLCDLAPVLVAFALAAMSLARKDNFTTEGTESIPRSLQT